MTSLSEENPKLQILISKQLQNPNYQMPQTMGDSVCDLGF
jgi:hypothetical protein